MTPQVLYGLLVGSHFRPPAKQILAALPQSFPLTLRAEPDNPYDPQALAVYCGELEKLPPEALEGLAQELPSCGWTLDLLLQEGEVHLGYAARASNKDRSKKADASPTGVITAADALPEGPATLWWGPNGEALLKVQQEEEER